MNILTLTEYAELRLGNEFGADKKTVSKKQFAWLKQFNEDYKKRHHVAIFKYGWDDKTNTDTLIAQNFVGIIHLGNTIIEILPKIEKIGNTENIEPTIIRQNLLKMLMISRNLNVLPGEISSTHSQDSFWDILMHLFCKRLRQAITEGQIRRYEYQEDILPVLRGRLDIMRQIQLLPTQAHLLACRFDEFTLDTPINQILKATLRIIASMANNHKLQQSAHEMIVLFDEVSDIFPSALRWDRVFFDRLTTRYEPLLKIARMLIEKAPPDIITGNKTGFSILFDMNKLFEEYIGTICQRLNSSERTIFTQEKSKYLLNKKKNKNTEETCFQLIPDIVVREKETRKVSSILDTKWKVLDDNQNYNGVSQSDIYQMFAYSNRYQATKVILVYPYHKELSKDHIRDGIITTYYFEKKDDPNKESKQYIQIATVDLSDLGTVEKQLETIIEHNPDS